MGYTEGLFILLIIKMYYTPSRRRALNSCLTCIEGKHELVNMASTDWNLDGFNDTQVGSCVLESPLSISSIGAVFLARQERPHRLVAVKLIHRQLARDSETWQLFLARFQREADATANLDHTNIVPIYEFGEAGDLAYLVMPYFPEGSLATRLEQRGPISLPETVQFVEQVAAALDYAHARGIIHRDVKPANMLIHPDGRVMLGDFGIARPLRLPDQTSHLAPALGEQQSKASLTQVGTAMGTPEYMAPEQVRMETLTPATDVYGLGIAAYELLGGKTPFEGADVPTVLLSHVMSPPPLLRALCPDLPTQVEEVIFWALAKDPSDRPATAGQFAKALRASLTTEPPESGNSWPLPSAPSLDPVGAVEGQKHGGHQLGLSEATLPLDRSSTLSSATILPPDASAGRRRRAGLLPLVLPLPAKLRQPRALVAAALAVALTVAALLTGLLVLRLAGNGAPSASGSRLPAALAAATATGTTLPTATPQRTATRQATATVSVPRPSPTASPTLMIKPTPLVLKPSPQNPNMCLATQTIINTTGHTVGWQWQQPQEGGFHFQINGGPMMDWPKDLQPGIPPGGSDTLTATSNCQPQPKVSGILVTDTRGDQYTFVLQLQ
jgi:serine/threonine protein kinase